MTDKKSDVTQIDPWQQLKTFTRARIAIGRVGSSLPTKEVLNFGLSHAMARDAVYLALDVDALENDIQSLGFETIRVHSKAENRATYLLRPDYGRRLNEQSISALKNLKQSQPIDFLIVVGDGLSSLAVSRHVAPMLAEIKNALSVDTSLNEWSASRVVIASQARVAIADEIGETLNAKIVAMLIGERPGLSSPDSLGIYLTHAPKVGLSDADRNCISNVRPEGLQYATAAKKLIWLAKEAMRLKVTGVRLKDESDVQELNSTKTAKLS
jgi:ethanolamine ammonia-lyase small subunit